MDGHQELISFVPHVKISLFSHRCYLRVRIVFSIYYDETKLLLLNCCRSLFPPTPACAPCPRTDSYMASVSTPSSSSDPAESCSSVFLLCNHKLFCVILILLDLTGNIIRQAGSCDEKNSMSRFAEVLEQLREKKQIRKKDLTHRSGLSSGYISLLTRGNRSAPSEEVVAALANALE